MTPSEELHAILREARDAYPEAMTPDQVMQASVRVAEKIIGHEHAKLLVATLARTQLMSMRRERTRQAEKDARDAENEARDRRFEDEDRSKPRWTGDDKPPGKQGRYRPRAKNARDDAADAARTAFLDTPIGIPGEPFAEVMWGDATLAILRDRKAWFTTQILGLQDSQAFIGDKIEKIEQAQEMGEPEETTLREAYRKLGLLK